MSEAKWTSESADNNQLWIEAEAIVVGKFGIQPVYKTLQSIRDRTVATERAASRITDATLTGDLEMARDRIRELEQQLATLRAATQGAMPDGMKQDIGLCAAAVVLAYYRKTHDHILADDDTINAAMRVEHFLGRR